MSLSTISALTQIMGSGVSGFGQYQQGQNQQAAYDYNANIALDKTRQELKISESKFSRLKGEQRALMAKAGVDLTSGSPLLILADTAMQEEEEMQRIRRSDISEYKMQKYAGKVASWSGTTGGMSTFITGLGKTGLDYAKYKGAK